MPSSDLAYKTLHTALDTKSRALARPNCPQFHDDVFVETSGSTSAIVYMFIARSTTTFVGSDTTVHRYGVFANVDRRAASPPRVDTIVPDDVSAFLDSLPALSLVAAAPGDQGAGGATFEVRVRNVHVDITMHFANPRPPRTDLVALGTAIRELVAIQTS